MWWVTPAGFMVQDDDLHQVYAQRFTEFHGAFKRASYIVARKYAINDLESLESIFSEAMLYTIKHWKPEGGSKFSTLLWTKFHWLVSNCSKREKRRISLRHPMHIPPCKVCTHYLECCPDHNHVSTQNFTCPEACTKKLHNYKKNHKNFANLNVYLWTNTSRGKLDDPLVHLIDRDLELSTVVKTVQLEHPEYTWIATALQEIVQQERPSNKVMCTLVSLLSEKYNVSKAYVYRQIQQLGKLVRTTLLA